ncbi:hypothetical protein WDU94_004405 [Cyamophila willieti]
MSVYFDYKVKLSEVPIEVVIVGWHATLPLLAVGVNTEVSGTVGGAVYICDELGDPLADVTPPLIAGSKQCVICWHPSRKLLVAGWSSGVQRAWLGGSEWLSMANIHSAAILQLQFSQLGTRLASLDESGLLSCWQCQGGSQVPSLHFKLSLLGEPSCLSFLNAAPGLDVNDLARRAVAGDTRALDMFSAWRPRTGGRKPGTGLQTDATGLFVGTLAGNIYHVSGSGVHVDVLSNESPVRSLLHHPTQPVLIVLTQGPVIGHYISDSDGALTEVTKVKLNGVRNETSLVWAGNSSLAFPTQEFRVRIWEIDTGESYLLHGGGTDEATSPLAAQWMISVSYSREKKLLCGGSNLGNIVIWRRGNGQGTKWEEVATCSVQSFVKQTDFINTSLAVNANSSVFILREHAMCAHYSDQVSAVQTSAARLTITSVGDDTSVDRSTELSTEFQVAGVAVSKQNIVVWSGKTVAVYRLDTSDSTGLTISALGSFGCECERILIFDQSLLILSLSGDVTLHTLQGTVKQSLSHDSQVLCMDMNGHCMATATVSAYLYVWDLARREAKLVTSPKDLNPLISNLGEVMQCRINANATQVSLTVAYTSLLPSPTLHVYLLDIGEMHPFTFATCDQTETVSSTNESPRFITNHYWDAHEPNILVVEGRIAQDGGERKEVPSAPPTAVLTCLHVSPEHGLLALETSRPMGQTFLSLLGVDAPHYVTLKKPSKQKVQAETVTMRDFDGIQCVDDVTRSAVINFSYYLNTGNLDQAFKSIASITSASVWTSLARMCVQTRRLDVARVCLGNMRDVRGLWVLRLAQDEPQLEARVAALAIHLQLYVRITYNEHLS